jgi:hypothetical protein
VGRDERSGGYGLVGGLLCRARETLSRTGEVRYSIGSNKTFETCGIILGHGGRNQV